MSEEEQIIAMFINGIAYTTGSTRLAEWVRKTIVQWQGPLWFLSLIYWSLLIYFLLLRK